MTAWDSRRSSRLRGRKGQGHLTSHPAEDLDGGCCSPKLAKRQDFKLRERSGFTLPCQVLQHRQSHVAVVTRTADDSQQVVWHLERAIHGLSVPLGHAGAARTQSQQPPASSRAASQDPHSAASHLVDHSTGHGPGLASSRRSFTRRFWRQHPLNSMALTGPTFPSATSSSGHFTLLHCSSTPCRCVAALLGLT